MCGKVHQPAAVDDVVLLAVEARERLRGVIGIDAHQPAGPADDGVDGDAVAIAHRQQLIGVCPAGAGMRCHAVLTARQSILQPGNALPLRF